MIDDDILFPGFIIDQEADSMKRAYNHALALSHLNSNATEIKDFISLTNIADSYLLTKSSKCQYVYIRKTTILDILIKFNHC